MTTFRFMFIEFETAEQASLAVKLIDGFKMDKSHTLAVNRFTDVEKYSTVEEQFHAPAEEEFIEKVRTTEYTFCFIWKDIQHMI